MSTDATGQRPLLSVTQVAERLGVSRATAYRKIADGTIPAYRLGDGLSALRVDPVELEDWLRRPEEAQ